MVKTNVKDTSKRKMKDDPEALFIPAGCLLGIGFGFLYNQLVVGLVIGLGLGFTIFALLSYSRKR